MSINFVRSSCQYIFYLTIVELKPYRTMPSMLLDQASANNAQNSWKTMDSAEVMHILMPAELLEVSAVEHA